MCFQVVLSVAICTKTGKREYLPYTGGIRLSLFLQFYILLACFMPAPTALLARQFVEMSRLRIEVRALAARTQHAISMATCK